MNCKSCTYTISPDDNYCAHCGSKIVHNRLSLKGTWEEFVGPFLSWDNNFWRTFFGLFKNPKDVLEAYISGARKKYFQPFSYLALYATIAVIFYKIFPFVEVYEVTANLNENISTTAEKSVGVNTQWLLTNMFNYYNFVIILSIPFYALTTFATFKKRGNNFSEHLVFNSYLQTNIGYFSILLQLLFLNTLHLTGLFFTIQIAFSFIISIYTFKKLYELNTKQTLLSIVRFCLFGIALYLCLIIVSFIITLLLKVINFI